MSQVVEMKGGRALLVEFETGPAINITSQDQGQVKAFIRDTCGMTGDRKFSWSYIGANATLPDTAKDPALLLRSSKVPYALGVERGRRLRAAWRRQRSLLLGPLTTSSRALPGPPCASKSSITTLLSLTSRTSRAESCQM